VKILLTGTSSFTGFWFAKELVNAGLEVMATFTKNSIEDYDGIRKERISLLLKDIIPVFNCRFGDDKFLEIIKSGIDVLCHHGADVTNYKSNSFDIAAALKNNTNNIIPVIEAIANSKCNSIVYTGSVFENNEGKGSLPLRAFSPYGLSKSFAYETLKFFCEINKVKLGKFVIPNPFGPYEEARFTSFLIQNWFNGNTPQIKTPSYVRDNIHVDLLAKSYADFVNNAFYNETMNFKINPSCYAESQGKFANRFAAEMRKRLNIRCEVELLEQTDFSEPIERINTNNEIKSFDWNEISAWNNLAEYYSKNFKDR
jgi:UDP-glucose 4-epimerase